MNIQYRRTLEQTLYRHMRLYGYQLIDVPEIEKADIFLTRAGDKIIDKLLTFEKRGQLMALRPEFTASAANYYVQQNMTETVRWQFQGNIFEDVPDRYSHDYQRYHIGAELIALSGMEAEAEVISMMATGLLKAGITEWKLVIGHPGLQTHLLRQHLTDQRTANLLLSKRDLFQNSEEPAQSYEDLIVALSEPDSEYATISNSGETQKMLDVLLDSTPYGGTMGGRSRKAIATRLLQKQTRNLTQTQIQSAIEFLKVWGDISAPAAEAFERIADLMDEQDKTGLELLAAWETTLDLLEAYNIHPERIVIQPDLARNWEYYTGIVFGIRLADGTYIAAGGRYDELTRLLGSEKTIPAVGMAYYVDRILPLLDNQAPTTIALQLTCENDTVQAAMWANILRECGFIVIISPTGNLSPDFVLEISATGKLLHKDKSYPIDDIDLLSETLRTANH